MAADPETPRPRPSAAGPCQGAQGGSRRATPPTSPTDPGSPGRELEPAGRHANGVGDGFAHLVGFTVLGAALPGTGLLAAGRRKSGWALIALLIVLTSAVAVLALTTGGRALVLRLATDPNVLLAAAIGIGAIAAAWCAVIVTSHLALRRHAGTGGQRAAAALLLTALVALVAVPAATASRYALSARSTLTSVFAGGTSAGRGAGAAAPDATAADPWAGEPRVNVLLLGSDFDAEHTGIRPDTLIVASIDTHSGDTALISLPRNLQKAPFPPGSAGARAWPDGFGSTTDGNHILNAVWREWGQAHPEDYPDTGDPGLAATRSVVSTITGLPIDYSVVVNIDGFRQLVDAMGGLTLTVPKDLPIGGGYNLDRNGNKVRIGGTAAHPIYRSYPVEGYVKAGKNQQLDGYHALWFARSRWQSDDYERINRQRCVLQAAVQQYGPAQIATAFPAVAATANRNIETDIAPAEIPAFITLGQRVKAGTLTSLAFTSDVIDTTDPDYPQMRQLVQQALAASDAPTPTRPTATPNTSAPTPTPSPDDQDPLAAPKGNPIVDTATVCG